MFSRKIPTAATQEAINSHLTMNRAGIYSLLILAATLLAYANSFSGPFIFDDLHWIEENPHIRHLWPLWNTLQAPQNVAGTGRPVVCLTLALNYAVSGLDPWSYHAANLAIHVAAALMLFGIVRRTLEGPRLRNRFATHANGLAAAVAVCWAVHPLQTESVTYTIHRTESLMGLFLLLTLYCLVRGHNSARRSWWYATAVICCALGMATKEGMVIAPIIVLLYDRIFLADSWAEIWKQRSALYAGLAATWLILISLIIVNQAGGGRVLDRGAGVSSWRYAKNQLGAIAHYLRLTFWPDALCADYAWEVSPLPRSWKVAGVILALCLIPAMAWALAKAAPLGFLGVWFFVTLAPTSSVLPIRDMVAERRMYLPMAAVVTLTVIAAWKGLSTLSRRLKLAPSTVGWAFCALVAAALAWRTAQRNYDYHSELAIWSKTTQQRPLNGRAWTNLGCAYFKAGQFDSAVACLNRAIDVLPTYSLVRATAYLDLADVRFAQGRYDEAIMHLSEALRLNPYDADAHNNLAGALQKVGDREQAMIHFRTAIRLQPDHALAHYNMGLLLTQVGDFDEALRELQTARRLRPDRPEIPFKLGVLLRNHGHYSEACANFTDALRLKPDFQEALQYFRFCEEGRHKAHTR